MSMSSTKISQRIADQVPYGHGLQHAFPLRGAGKFPCTPRSHPYNRKAPSRHDAPLPRLPPKQHARKHHTSHSSASLLNRLSTSSLSPTSTLLERIGAQADADADADDAGRATTSSEAESTIAQSPTPVPGATDPDELASRTLNKPAAVGPGEVERFLQSVIYTPTMSEMSPPVCRRPRKAKFIVELTYLIHRKVQGPRLSQQPHMLAGSRRVKQEDTSRSPPLRYVAEDVADPDRLLPRFGTVATNAEDYMAGRHVPRPSESVLEQCRSRLAPVVLASAQSRDPRTRWDVEQCATLLTDDRCAALFRHAKDMRAQLEACGRVPRAPTDASPEYQGHRGHQSNSLPRRYHDPSVRRECGGTAETPSRRDSDMTLVEVPLTKGSYHDISPYVHGQDGDGIHQRCASILKAEIHSPRLSVTSLVAEPPPGDVDQVIPVTRGSPPQDLQFPHLTVPGIWSVCNGTDTPDVTDIVAMVNEDLFSRETGRIDAIVRLYCLKKDEAESLIDSKGSPSEAIASLQNSHSRWPHKGTLIIQVNPGLQKGKTWLPYALESALSLDVTSCISPEKNVLRFISLSDLSDFTFVLCAFPLQSEEVTSGSDRSLSAPLPPKTQALETATPHDVSLSDFARLPIAIRA
ncbi:hypothetical protein ID866_8264 [Astraeus odoratus]|nr:hypothetical protein ID866_8264 [Astraeus odoratus]